jgi:pimeloyl-ACP methyl ester carboxylesterase
MLWVLFPVPAGAAVAVAFVLALCAPALVVLASFIFATGAAGRSVTVADVVYLLRALLTEAVAFTLILFAMVAGRAEQSLRAAPRGRDRPVLLIHGIVCNKSVWRRWLQRLQTAGFGPLRVLDLEPPFADIEFHAARVERELRALSQDSHGQRVAIVAHSMGGLVARAALRRVGPELISNIVTIASPHYGSRLARWFRLRPTEQMCPESAWLHALNAEQEAAMSDVSLTSIYSLEDNLIVPARSAVFKPARSVELRGIGHVGMLFSREVIESTLGALAHG